MPGKGLCQRRQLWAEIIYIWHDTGLPTNGDADPDSKRSRDEGCYLQKNFCICHQVLTLATANILPFLPTGAVPNLLPPLGLSTEHRKHTPMSSAMPASNPSRQSAHPAPHSVTRLAMPDEHGYVSFVPIPINQAVTVHGLLHTAHCLHLKLLASSLQSFQVEETHTDTSCQEPYAALTHVAKHN